jgi:hypothetical protein
MRIGDLRGIDVPPHARSKNAYSISSLNIISVHEFRRPYSVFFWLLAFTWNVDASGVDHVDIVDGDSCLHWPVVV